MIIKNRRLFTSIVLCSLISASTFDVQAMAIDFDIDVNARNERNCGRNTLNAVRNFGRSVYGRWCNFMDTIFHSKIAQKADALFRRAGNTIEKTADRVLTRAVDHGRVLGNRALDIAKIPLHATESKLNALGNNIQERAQQSVQRVLANARIEAQNAIRPVIDHAEQRIQNVVGNIEERTNHMVDNMHNVIHVAHQRVDHLIVDAETRTNNLIWKTVFGATTLFATFFITKYLYKYFSKKESQKQNIQHQAQAPIR